MARALIASDTTIRNIKPGDPRKRLNDGEELYLLLFVKGGGTDRASTIRCTGGARR
jgi:hypothetical protein